MEARTRSIGVAPWSIVALLLLATSCASGPTASNAPVADAPEAPPRWTEQDREESLASFDQVWKTIQERHYDPDLNGVDWEAARDELRPRVAEATRRSEVRAILQQLIGRLGESHFAIVPDSAYESVEAEEPEPAPKSDTDSDASANSSAQADADTSHDANDSQDASDSDEPAGPGESGIVIRVVDGAALVVEASGPAKRAGLKTGWIVTAIGEREMSELFARIESEEPLQQTMLREAAVLNRLRGDAGDVLSIRCDSPEGGRTVDVVLDPAEGVPVRTGFMPALAFKYDDEIRESGVGYFRFNLFIDPNRLTPAFGEAMTRFIEADAPGVILDLRGNPGGIGILASTMSGWFFEESGRSLGTMKMRSGDLRFMVFPQPETFRGKLAVLIDGQSGSTSEILAGGLQDHDRARIFGLRSAGAALPSVFEKLPNGDGFQFAIADFLRPSGARLEGIGVEPDSVVGYDREVLLTGRDPMIAAAERWITTQSAQNSQSSQDTQN